MFLVNHLHFTGNCETAFRFYADALDGKLEMLTRYKDAPPGCPVPEDFREKVMHARLVVNPKLNAMLFGCDAPPDRQQPPAGFSVSVQLDNAAEAERVFGALAEGGQVHMPLQKTFFAERFGMLADQFGVAWMVNCGPSGNTEAAQ